MRAIAVFGIFAIGITLSSGGKKALAIGLGSGFSFGKTLDVNVNPLGSNGAEVITELGGKAGGGFVSASKHESVDVSISGGHGGVPDVNSGAIDGHGGGGGSGDSIKSVRIDLGLGIGKGAAEKRSSGNTVGVGDGVAAHGHRHGDLGVNTAPDGKSNGGGFVSASKYESVGIGSSSGHGGAARGQGHGGYGGNGGLGGNLVGRGSFDSKKSVGIGVGLGKGTGAPGQSNGGLVGADDGGYVSASKHENIVGNGGAAHGNRNIGSGTNAGYGGNTDVGRTFHEQKSVGSGLGLGSRAKTPGQKNSGFSGNTVPVAVHGNRTGGSGVNTALNGNSDGVGFVSVSKHENVGIGNRRGHSGVLHEQEHGSYGGNAGLGRNSVGRSSFDAKKSAGIGLGQGNGVNVGIDNGGYASASKHESLDISIGRGLGSATQGQGPVSIGAIDGLGENAGVGESSGPTKSVRIDLGLGIGKGAAAKRSGANTVGVGDGITALEHGHAGSGGNTALDGNSNGGFVSSSKHENVGIATSSGRDGYGGNGALGGNSRGRGSSDANQSFGIGVDLGKGAGVAGQRNGGLVGSEDGGYVSASKHERLVGNGGAAHGQRNIGSGTNGEIGGSTGIGRTFQDQKSVEIGLGLRHRAEAAGHFIGASKQKSININTSGGRGGAAHSGLVENAGGEGSLPDQKSVGFGFGHGIGAGAKGSGGFGEDTVIGGSGGDIVSGAYAEPGGNTVVGRSFKLKKLNGLGFGHSSGGSGQNRAVSKEISGIGGTSSTGQFGRGRKYSGTEIGLGDHAGKGVYAQRRSAINGEPNGNPDALLSLQVLKPIGIEIGSGIGPGIGLGRLQRIKIPLGATEPQ